MTAATNTSLGTIKLAGDLAGSTDANAPELTLSGVIAGIYGTNPTLTVNSKGVVTEATSGSAIDVFNIPIATSTTYGTVKIGSGVSIAGDGTISMAQATTIAYGTAKVGSGLLVSSGVISLDSAYVPQLASGFQYTGAISITPVVNASATGSVTLNLLLTNIFELTLVGNVTLNAPSNIPVGGTYYIILKQDGTGSRTCTFNSAFLFESGSSNVLSTAPNAIDVLRVTVSSIGLSCKLLKNFQ